MMAKVFHETAMKSRGKEKNPARLSCGRPCRLHRTFFAQIRQWWYVDAGIDGAVFGLKSMNTADNKKAHHETLQNIVRFVSPRLGARIDGRHG
jgi:hypothetical protein